MDFPRPGRIGSRVPHVTRFSLRGRKLGETDDDRKNSTTNFGFPISVFHTFSEQISRHRCQNSVTLDDLLSAELKAMMSKSRSEN